MDEAQALINRYVDVCNAALWRNRDRFPFKQILGAAQKAESGRLVETVVEARGQKKQDSFVMTLDKGQIVVRPHGSCADCGCERRWIVHEDYLQDVIRHPDVYINNPARLDWDWLYEAKSA